MFGTESKSHDARRDAAQDWEPIHKPHWKWHIHRPIRAQRGANQTILKEDLNRLDQPHGQLAPSLNTQEVGRRDFTFPQSRRENVGRSHRILNGHVDSDSTNRRHGMRRVADT